MATRLALQGVYLTDLLNSIEQQLLNATLLNDSYIVECYEDEETFDRPKEGEPYCILYKLGTEQPFLYDGATLLGHATYIILEIIIKTRLTIDIAGNDKIWSRDASIVAQPSSTPPIPAGRGAQIIRLAVQQAFQDQYLFKIGVPNTPSTCLCTEGIQQLSCPTSRKDKSDKTLGYTYMYFQIKNVQPLVYAQNN